MSTVTANKLKIKDIITATLLALINVVIFFASSVLYATPITIILMPVFFALLEGIVYFIIGTKVKKPGAILIYSIVRAIMGGYLPYIILFILSGVIAELLLWKMGYGNAKTLTVSYVINQVLAAFGSTIIPYAIAAKAMADQMVTDGRQDAILAASQMLQSWVSVALVAGVIVAAFIGTMIGKRIVKKHLAAECSRKEFTMKKIEPNRSAASWLAELAKGRYGEYALSVLTALLGVACSLIPYFIIIRLITALVDGTAELTYCLTLCAWMAGCWVLRYVLHSVSTSLSHHATFHVLANTRTRLLDKLATLPLGTVLDRSSGSYKNIIVERVDSIETTLAHLLPEMTANIVGALAVLVLLFIEDWRMGLSMLIVVPLGIICFMSMFSGYNEKFQRTVTATKALNDTAVEYISGIEVIKAFGQSKTSYAKFVSAAKEGADCFIDWMRGSLFGQAAGMAIFPSTLLGILPVGCLLYMHGTLSAETFLAIIVLSFGVMQPLITAFSYTDDIAQVTTIVGEVAEVLSGEDMQRPESAEKLPADNSIELKNVRFAYHDKEVLHGINLHIAPGTVNALVGLSGSGKSTIARLIASLWDVKDGTIKLGGVDIRTLPLAECTKRIAYVSQDNYLFDLSVIDNIRMGKKGATDEEVIDAAKKCGCHEFIMGLENGYQTICGASGGHLSGGERQRISIARAMLKDAAIVILDEATSYTDPENEAVIQSALAKLVRGKTLLVIAHRLSTIADAGQIIVVNHGKIEATGTQSELLASCPLYQTMWEAHISVKDDGEVA